MKKYNFSFLVIFLLLVLVKPTLAGQTVVLSTPLIDTTFNQSLALDTLTTANVPSATNSNVNNTGVKNPSLQPSLPERFYIGLGLHKIHGNKYKTNSSVPFSPYYTSNYSTDIVFGYNFKNWFALEGEINSGSIFQQASYGFSVTDPSSSNTYNIYGYDSYYLYNILINGVFRHHLNEKNIPFIKLGLGYSKYNSESGILMIL